MGLTDATYYQERMGDSEFPPEQGARWAAELGWRLEQRSLEQRQGPLDTKHNDLPSDGDDSDVSFPAFVNRGRWLVGCPCGGAQLVCRTDLRAFCLHCGNFGFDGRWVAVVWPEEADKIESILLLRPYHQNRNWVPGETIEQLQMENDIRDLRTGQIDIKRLPVEPTDPFEAHVWAGLAPEDYVALEDRPEEVVPRTLEETQ